ncbi:unnamed protein product [Phytophthora lilii]|uniref:Unnamed protein product n=1 Tax=Phytophthora lilii TaxID=2077276 RepID=A0A9W6XBM3_9STRA|nr:unnamed protein product [Phytophthora lilii]
MPAWAFLNMVAMAFQWARKIRQDSKAVVLASRMTKFWMCDVLLVCVYPPYYYIFTTLSPNDQKAFTILLPVIKLLMRNTFVKALTGHLHDETPNLVIFNADMFGSMFIAYCMQSTPSVWTTLELMAADFIIIRFSLRDIRSASSGLEELKRELESDFFSRHHIKAVGRIGWIPTKLTMLERASIILETPPPMMKNSLRKLSLKLDHTSEILASPKHSIHEAGWKHQSHRS